MPLTILMPSQDFVPEHYHSTHTLGIFFKANLLNWYSALCWRPVTHGPVIAHSTDSEDFFFNPVWSTVSHIIRGSLWFVAWSV